MIFICLSSTIYVQYRKYQDFFTLCKKDGKGGNRLGVQTNNLKGSPGVICTSDARAMDFYYQIEHIPSGTMEVCVTIRTFSQVKNIYNPTFNNTESLVNILSLFIFINYIKMYFQKVQNRIIHIIFDYLSLMKSKINKISLKRILKVLIKLCVNI